MNNSKRGRTQSIIFYFILISVALGTSLRVQAEESLAKVAYGGFKSNSTGLKHGLNISGIATMRRVPDGRTIVDIKVKGLPPKTNYTAYVHIMACEDNQGGSRYQNVAGNSADDTNEIFLGFTSNTAGIGMSHAMVDFITRAEAKSVVVQGAEGVRLACADLN